MPAYFDNAATTFPKPEEVYRFMDFFYRNYGGNAGRGQYKLAAEASKLMAETRQLVQQVLGCGNKDIIFTPSDTIALNMIIQGSMNDSIKNVYVSPFEHNSVTRILHHFEELGHIQVRELSLGEGYQYDLEEIRRQFDACPPDMVVVSHVSNVCGLIAPVEDIFREAKKYQALTIVDMAQSAGLVPLPVNSEAIDYAVFAGHKTLYGPFGISGFAKKKGISLRPIMYGGTGVDSANQDMPDVLPQKYEAGSQNIQAAAGLHAALTWLLANAEAIGEKEKQNHRKLLEILRSHSNIQIVGPENRENCIGVVSCLFDGYSPDNIGDVFDEMEIAVRTGLQCAPLAHRKLGTFPAGTVRFSVGYFTSEDDFNALEEALTYIEENG